MMCLSKRVSYRSLSLAVVCAGLLTTVSSQSHATSKDWNPLRVTIPNVTSLPDSLPTYFVAKDFNYNAKKGIVTVGGRVEVEHGETVVRADSIEYDQKKNIVRAKGNVVILEPNGDVKFHDKIVLKGNIKNGIISSFVSRLSDDKLFMAAEEQKNSKPKNTKVSEAKKIKKQNKVDVAEAENKKEDEVKELADSAKDIEKNEVVDNKESKPLLFRMVDNLFSSAEYHYPGDYAALEPAAGADNADNIVSDQPNVPLIVLPDPVVQEKKTPEVIPEEVVQVKEEVADNVKKETVAETSPVVKNDATVALSEDAKKQDDITVDLQKIIAPVDPDKLRQEVASVPPVNKENIAPKEEANVQKQLDQSLEKPVEQAVEQAEGKVEAKPVEQAVEQAEGKVEAKPVEQAVEKAEEKPQQKIVEKPKVIKKAKEKIVYKPTEEKSEKDVVMSTDSSEPNEELPKESVALLKKVSPKAIKKTKTESVQPFKVDRTRDMQDLFKADEYSEVQNESLGIKIEKKVPRVNIDSQLEKAYDAINSGNSDVAMETYKEILDNSPKNTQALFGLATLYHRARQFDQARVLYGKLLAINPQHRDGFNNFLVLLADEAPNEALKELEKLEDKSPGFATIPAQIAVIYQKLGQNDKAIDKMMRAVSLAPESLVYRYNLAIMLDKQKKYDEATKLYKQLVEAAQRGEKIPGNIENIQQRLTFISSNR